MKEQESCISRKAHITSIGGQAVMEGVMMRGPKKIAVSVRTPEGEIVTEIKPISSVLQKSKILKLPIIRGVVAFIESLIIGTKALMFSAEFADIEDDETKEKKKTMSEDELKEQEKKKEKMMSVTIFTSVVVALAFGIGVFMLLPTVLVGFLRDFAHTPPVLSTLLEGVTRIIIFVAYVLLASLMKDIRRVFEYHGAEHKTIFCYESGEELTVENARKFSRFHPRCGTSFLLIVMIISIIIFSFVSWNNPIQRVFIRLLLLPLVAGISYEIIKFAGRSTGTVMKIVSAPGKWLQRITTKEPDDSQLEVAIRSLESVLTGNIEDDKW